MLRTLFNLYNNSMKRFKWSILFTLPLTLSFASLTSCSAGDGWVRYGEEYDSPEFNVDIGQQVTITKNIDNDFVDFWPWLFVVFETKPSTNRIDIDENQSISIKVGQDTFEEYIYFDGALLFDAESFDDALKNHLSSTLTLKFHLKEGQHVPEKARATFWSPRP